MKSLSASFRLGIASTLALFASTFSSSALAQLQYKEGFENGAPGWQTLPGAGRCTQTVFEANRSLVIMSSTTAADCSGKFLRESIGACGGRAFSAPVATTPGQAYCLTTWMRHGAGANAESGYAGVNGTNAAGTQFLAEQWIIGGTIAGGDVPAANLDGKWHWYKSAFNATHAFTMIQVERFEGGNAANIDFDDMRIYKGACPAQPDVDEGTHGACSGGTPACDDTQGGICVECTADANCNGATPACKPSTKKCVACVTDAHCPANAWCNSGDNACKPDVANGQPIPTDAGHTPPLNGTCTAPIGLAVCQSGVCDTDNACGKKLGSACTATPECRTGSCIQGVCGTPSDGGASSGDGGSTSSSSGDGGSTSSSSSSSSGATSSGATSSGATSSGATSSGATSSGATSSGATSSGSSGNNSTGELGGGGCSTTSTSETSTALGVVGAALAVALVRRRRERR
ncbi:MAG: MYXO-CTERM sorting domain-containing protein [Polyangiaceae bacterium]